MEYPIKTGKPSFKEANTIGTTPGGAKSVGKMETGLFSDSALGSEIATTKAYAKSGKGGTVDKGVFCSTDDNNVIWPTTAS